MWIRTWKQQMSAIYCSRMLFSDFTLSLSSWLTLLQTANEVHCQKLKNTRALENIYGKEMKFLLVQVGLTFKNDFQFCSLVTTFLLHKNHYRRKLKVYYVAVEQFCPVTLTKGGLNTLKYPWFYLTSVDKWETFFSGSRAVSNDHVGLLVQIDSDDEDSKDLSDLGPLLEEHIKEGKHYNTIL